MRRIHLHLTFSVLESNIGTEQTVVYLPHAPPEISSGDKFGISNSMSLLGSWKFPNMVVAVWSVPCLPQYHESR